MLNSDEGYLKNSVDSVSSFFSTDYWESLGTLAGWSILAGVLVVAFILIFWHLGKRHFPMSVKRMSLKWPFIAIWIYGFVVYDVGMCYDEKIALLTNAPMAILYAFKIFFFESDISEIHGHFHENWAYSMNFALVHFLAAVFSTVFIIRIIGFNLVARLKLWKASVWPFRKRKEETYVFWDFNEATYRLIKSIQSHYACTENSDKFRIIIVRTGNRSEISTDRKAGLKRIFDFFSMPASELSRLEELGCFTVFTFENLRSLLPGKESNIIKKVLKLKSLSRIISRCTSKKLHLFFLSEDEKKNLHDASILLKDSTIDRFLSEVSDSSVAFYCHARYNSVHSVIEDQNPSERLKIKIIDSSHINVELLKQEAAFLPVNYVKVEKDATVSSPFNALVVGFSEVGKDVCRFLYEFGAFVQTGATENEAHRSAFNLQVVDKHMNDLAGAFVANAPAVRIAMPFVKGTCSEDGNSLITLNQMDCRSVEFYLKLEEWIKKLNYVVVATGDDEMNITLGVRIFKAAARYRNDMERFCIMVRNHSDEDRHIRNIARHYNLLWAAYRSAESQGENVHQKSVKNDCEPEGPIHIFGLDSEVYTYGNIVADELEQRAREYKDRYERTINPQIDRDKDIWEEFYKDRMQLKDGWEGYYPTLWGIMNLRRSQAQDFANSFHEMTKSVLVEKALSLCGLDRSAFSQLTRTSGTTHYSGLSESKDLKELIRIAITLAQTEHLRWNASHELIGFLPSEEKDEVRLLHDNLKDWKDLEKPIQSYDSNVADFILGIKLDK